MSKKDTLIKKIDEISERVRFWHNAMLTLLTTFGGMMFGLSQDKIEINKFVWIFGIMAVATIFLGLYRLDKLGIDRKFLFDELEKEK